MHLIDWMEWGEEAFATARDQDRPVLLSISASWCHWCHVMDHTTYSDPRVCTLINAEFVPIRVDNDRRPDINDRYNMGGWPTTCFLTPNGDIISGATYIPPDAMVEVLQQVLQYYRLNRSVVDTQAELLRLRSFQEAYAGPPAGALLTHRLVEEVTGLVLASFDRRFGGFGNGQKFPCFDALELLLSMHAVSRDKLLLSVVEHTLRAQHDGDLHDRQEGGFFRYCTRRDWTSPHFEKMLEDQAGHIRTYSLFSSISGDVWAADVARETLAYVYAHLYDADRGVFFGSQDADEVYYAKPLSERRGSRAPRVDRTIYTDWNARMASALVSLWTVDGDADHLSAAKACLDWLLANCRSSEGLMFHWHDGRPHLPGQLRDAAAVLTAALDVYEASGGASYLSAARELAEASRRVLCDADRGGFWDRPPDPAAPGRLAHPQKLITHNSQMASALIRLDWIAGTAALRGDALNALRWFAGRFQQWGHLSACYGTAVHAALSDPVLVRIVGRPDHPGTAAMLHTAASHSAPCKAVQTLHPERDYAAIGELGLDVLDAPAAYVCVGKTCSPPVGSAEELRLALARLPNPA